MKVGFQDRRRAGNFNVLIAFTRAKTERYRTVGVFEQFQTRNRALLFRKTLHVPR